MHAKLDITSSQEEQWAKVAEVMRDNARSMDSLMQSPVISLFLPFDIRIR